MTTSPSRVALDGALDRLAEASPRATRVVECRFFAGLTLQETADALDVSLKTVQRDWLLARAWLRKEVGHATLGHGLDLSAAGDEPRQPY